MMIFYNYIKELYIMILTKSFTHNKKKYNYIFADIHGLIEFFKLDLRIIPNFENLLKAHRPNDVDIKYTKIINEDIYAYLYEKVTTYYQIIYNSKTWDIITIARGNVLYDSGVCMFSMIHTNSSYRNQKFCQKNINLFICNLKSMSVKKFSLYVEIDNVAAVKCYENCGFKIIKVHKEKYYLMEID